MPCRFDPLVPHKRLLRVFPRRTSATPDDKNAIVGRGPDMFDEADEVHISVIFDWDIPKAESLALQWEQIAPVKIGGPALADPGADFTPGLYMKAGNVITSRGCPNSCWFCRAWKTEGRSVRELPINEGWNLRDNNILACTRAHQQAVFEMLARQPRRSLFSGGLEAARLTAWHVEWFTKLKPGYYFAYDMPEDFEPLVAAAGLLREAGLMRGHDVGCYVLIGWKGDTTEGAEKRLRDVMALGYMPHAMLYDRGLHFDEADRLLWQRLQREWANKVIVGSKMPKAKMSSAVA